MYRHIMVPMDGSELSESVFPHVEAVANGCKVSHVTLVHVVEPLHMHSGLESMFSPEERWRLEKDGMDIARNQLNLVVRRLKKKGVLAKVEVLHGHVVDKLVEYADKNEVDLIILCTHGRSGVGRLVLGSVADRLLRSTKVPVLMVRPLSE